MSSSRVTSKYISPIISYFIKSDHKRTPLEVLPKLFLDSNLISWGLLSHQFGADLSNGTKRKKQLFVIIFEWLLLFKWVVCMISDQNSISPVFSGDYIAYLPGKSVYYHVPIVLWTLLGALSATLFYLNSEDKQLSWLQIFEVCKGTLKPIIVKLDANEAAYFWQRTLITTWAAKFVIRIVTLISVVIIAYTFINLWPEHQLVPHGILWAFVSLIWIYYTTSIQCGVMAVFHQICYYMILRFEKVNKIAKQLDNTDVINTKSNHEKIYEFMLAHNDISKLLIDYNKFWRYNMAINFVVYVPMICFLINLVVFGDMLLSYRMVLCATIFGFVICFCVTAFSAGFVAEEAHNSYTILNSLTQTRMPIVLKTQLQIYIQRLGGPTLGFSCLDLFTVTFDSFFHSLLMITSFFLLFMDVNQSEIRNRSASQTIDNTLRSSNK